jgi:hypothetical protein
MRPVLLLAATVGVLACSSSSSPSMTYWRDVAPIVNDKCVKCHQVGGIAPFPLDSFETVRAMAPTIAGVTRTGYMPPFYVTHDGSCGDFQDGDALSPAQLATLIAWPKSELAEGTRTTLPLPRKPGLQSGDDVSTPAFAPQYRTGKVVDDDFRCFVAGSPLAADGHITAFEVLPGENDLAIDVTAYLFDPARITSGGKSNAELAQSLDDAAAGPGWPCQGSVGLEVDAIAAVHGPGQGAVFFPDGMGIPQSKTQRLVIQVHYSTNGSVAGMSEATTIRFQHGPATRSLVYLVRDPFLDTLTSTPASLPPGQIAATFTWMKSAAELGAPGAVDLVGVTPHMQDRGRAVRLSLDGACSAEVPTYYWGWQRTYFYRAPYPRLQPATQLGQTCTYTTGQDDQPVRPGWLSSEEMCSAILLVAP